MLIDIVMVNPNSLDKEKVKKDTSNFNYNTLKQLISSCNVIVYILFRKPTLTDYTLKQLISSCNVIVYILFRKPILTDYTLKQLISSFNIIVYILFMKPTLTDYNKVIYFKALYFHNMNYD